MWTHSSQRQIFRSMWSHGSHKAVVQVVVPVETATKKVVQVVEATQKVGVQLLCYKSQRL